MIKDHGVVRRVSPLQSTRERGFGGSGGAPLLRISDSNNLGTRRLVAEPNGSLQQATKMELGLELKPT
jgi:hypothetical protein